MGMRNYSIWECVISEAKIIETIPKEYQEFKDVLSKYGVSIFDLAQAERYDDIYELETHLDIPEDIDSEVVMAEIEKVYSSVMATYQKLSGIPIYLSQPDSDADISVEYFWAAPLKMARQWEDAGATILCWNEYG